MSAAAAEDPFLFLLLLAGLEASGTLQVNMFCLFYHETRWMPWKYKILNPGTSRKEAP